MLVNGSSMGSLGTGLSMFVGVLWSMVVCSSTPELRIVAMCRLRYLARNANSARANRGLRGGRLVEGGVGEYVDQHYQEGGAWPGGVWPYCVSIVADAQ